MLLCLGSPETHLASQHTALVHPDLLLVPVSVAHVLTGEEQTVVVSLLAIGLLLDFLEFPIPVLDVQEAEDGLELLLKLLLLLESTVFGVLEHLFDGLEVFLTLDTLLPHAALVQTLLLQF